MGLRLEFTLDLPGATKVALKVDHDKDGLIDDEKDVKLTHSGSTWKGSVELAGTDPEGVLYVYTVTTSKESARYEVRVVRADTKTEVGQANIGTISKGSFYIARWVGGP